jgi:phosphoserine aminotransferase
METLLWSLLGERGVDVLTSCVFSEHWSYDVTAELKIPDARIIRAEFPNISDVSEVDFNRDVVFCLSYTTSGAAFRNLDWIQSERRGLTICDAASGAFAIDCDWRKLDATAFSWQKGLGGEAGFGSIVLSPQAIARLESYIPCRPIPRIFRIANGGRVNFPIFDGFTINTPSMLCLEDFLDALTWADELGGMKALLHRVRRNEEVVKKWIARQKDFRFLVDEKYRAPHIACFEVTSASYQALDEKDKWNFLREIVAICQKEGVGFDFLGHIMTKPHLRVWCGPTVEAEDLEKFLPWISRVHDKMIRG